MATGSGKRSSVDYEDISSITSPESKANVHGVVTSLSPIKPNAKRPFFEGYLSNGPKKMRFVGFNGTKEKTIANFSKEKHPVTLSNCCIKNNKYTDGLELIIGDNTSITKSPVKFEIEIPDSEQIIVDTTSTKGITVDKLEEQPAYQKFLLMLK